MAMSSTPHVLVLSASIGGGHMRAAEAVTLALREIAPHAVVENVDVLTLTNSFFRRIYRQIYLGMISATPHLLGSAYEQLDKPPGLTGHIRDRLRVMYELVNFGPLLRYLRARPWDAVINTHFLPADIIAALTRKGKVSTPQITVTTDFETHRVWVNEPSRLYTTATEDGKVNLAAWGIPADNIVVTGIPIHPVFAKSKTRAECLAAQELPGDRPVVLQLAGSIDGPIEQVYKTIQKIARPLDIVAVTGHNAKARQRLLTVPVPPQHRCRIVGFTDKMDELLGAADLVVTKPGGLVSSEILARGAAMIIVNPIPGQETRNSDFLLERGAAVKANNMATMCHKVGQLLADGERVAALRRNALAIARPRAAYDVAALALGLLKTSAYRQLEPGPPVVYARTIS